MAKFASVEDEIKHFLRLAEDKSATQPERDLASARAERLISKHVIDRLSLDLDADASKPREEIVTKTVWMAGGGGSISFDMMLGLCEVARAMQCYPYYTDMRKYKRMILNADGKFDKMQSGILLSLVGFVSDVEATIQMINSFQTQAPVALRAWQRSSEWAARTIIMDKADKWRVSLSFLRAFGTGAAERIRETRKSVLNEYDDRTALVIVDRSKQVNDHVNSTMNLGTKRDRRSVSSAGNAAGREAGRNAAGANQQGALRQHSRAVSA